MVLSRKTVKIAWKKTLSVLFVLAVLAMLVYRRCSAGDCDRYEAEILVAEARVDWTQGREGFPARGEGGGNIEQISDLIPLNRTIRDMRPAGCALLAYDATLPSVSVVIIFHDEAWSWLLRAVWNVLLTCRRDQPWHRHVREGGELGYPGQAASDRYLYLRELLLVDDGSPRAELRGRLDHYVRTRLPALVRVLRLPNRLGPAGARQAGVAQARGDVLVFLDAHCEGQRDWLRPLLQLVKDDGNTVAVPKIDSLCHRFGYVPRSGDEVGGFDAMFNVVWHATGGREGGGGGGGGGGGTRPTRTPVTAGGVLAMARARYWALGGADPSIRGWGAENFELSFKTWMCGGALLAAPCSRVGHVCRALRTAPPARLRDAHTRRLNAARVAAVWMDQYSELLWMYHPDLKDNALAGDACGRRALRRRLRCRDFAWFLRHVYAHKFVPGRDVDTWGRLRDPRSGRCVTLTDRSPGAAAAPCREPIEGAQLWALTGDRRLRNDESCLTVARSQLNNFIVATSSCHQVRVEPVEEWLHSGGRLVHAGTGRCLAAPGGALQAVPCSQGALWQFDFTPGYSIHRDLFSSLEQLTSLQYLSRS